MGYTTLNKFVPITRCDHCRDSKPVAFTSMQTPAFKTSCFLMERKRPYSFLSTETALHATSNKNFAPNVNTMFACMQETGCFINACEIISVHTNILEEYRLFFFVKSRKKWLSKNGDYFVNAHAVQPFFIFASQLFYVKSLTNVLCYPFSFSSWVHRLTRCILGKNNVQLENKAVCLDQR